MLSELQNFQQESDETVWHTDINVSIETRNSDDNELIHKEYTFSYSNEWDKWTFHEYKEKRTPDTARVSERNWSESRHILWSDVNDTPTIDVPPEVADALAEATDSDSVTLQVPSGSINENSYEEVYEV